MRHSENFPANEPIRNYNPGSDEASELKKEIAKLRSEEIEIPLIIGGKPVHTGNTSDCMVPHDHGHRLGLFHQAGEKEIRQAIQHATKAGGEWSRMKLRDRAAIFLKAAQLISTRYRAMTNAATLVGQSKNVYQSEIDAVCETIDFLRFNAAFAESIASIQPVSTHQDRNRLESRALEGFVFAIAPFNFTSIAVNLAVAPALMGNTVIWKPASTAVFSSWKMMEILMEAGLPEGVINFLPGSGSLMAKSILTHPDLAGVHFTGSTHVFKGIWQTVGQNIAHYKTYPRLVGETGGKDFVFVHASADVRQVVTAMIRGAFEYQGQKCSAASRAYVPDSLWPELKQTLIEEMGRIKMGPPEDFANFVNAVIDRASFSNITEYVAYARAHPDAEIIVGGGADQSTGHFVEPAVIQCRQPDFKTMAEEIFGPVLSIFVYPEKQYKDMLRVCDRTSPYALTGAIFARDRKAIQLAEDILLHAAGNFYVNDKPTGAVVGQQPFGGARASGTNDKAGSLFNLIRWTSPRTVKENLAPPTSFEYPFMRDEQPD